MAKQPKPPTRAELPLLCCADAQALARWLAANHQRSPGVWIQLAKKGSALASPSYAEALHAALAWGWIDGQKGAIDASAYRVKLTPRRPRSLWSAVNCAKAEALIASGEMRPAGLAEVERARRDGRWAAAYPSPSRATVPADLAAALAQHPAAGRLFETLEGYNRYAVLHRVHTAKKPETRAKHIAEFVAMLARGEKPHPARVRKPPES